MSWARIVLPATATATFIVVGCAGMTDESSEPMPTAEEPAALSFVVDDDPSPIPNDAVSVNAPAALRVESSTEVHSGPGGAYTVLSTLAAGEAVDSTGVRVVAEGITWVEIQTDAVYNGWVDEADLDSNRN